LPVNLAENGAVWTIRFTWNAPRWRVNFGVAIASILLLSSRAYAISPQRSIVGGDARTHTVESGETLFSIARQHGLAYPAVVRANGIDDPNLVQKGKVLTLPMRYVLPKTIKSGIVVNIPEYTLYVFHNGVVQAVFPVAIGLPTWQTPLGSFTIINKIEHPSWTMPPEMSERENMRREIVQTGRQNPLGDLWIGTSLKHVGIHGTNSPMSIGRALSHGCLRMYPEHIRRLAELVSAGDHGEIMYETVKIAIIGKTVFIEIHPDVYRRLPSADRVVENKLRSAGVWKDIDTAALSGQFARLAGHLSQ
jgi:L,D-transpeptidase ErfK/SrfK